MTDSFNIMVESGVRYIYLNFGQDDSGVVFTDGVVDKVVQIVWKLLRKSC